MNVRILTLALLGACAPGVASTQTSVPVESSTRLDVAPLNARVVDAASDGLTWPFSAILVAVSLVGGDGELREFTLSSVANRAEAPDSAVVTVTRDGFLDDSVRGDWHQITLVLTGAGTWMVAEALRAQRCWRGPGSAFRAGPCN